MKIKLVLLTFLLICCFKSNAQTFFPTDSIKDVTLNRKDLEPTKDEHRSSLLIITTECLTVDEAFQTVVNKFVKEHSIPKTIDYNSHFLITDWLAFEGEFGYEIQLTIVVYEENEQVFLSVSGEMLYGLCRIKENLERAPIEYISNCGDVLKQAYISMKEISLSLLPHKEIRYEKRKYVD